MCTGEIPVVTVDFGHVVFLVCNRPGVCVGIVGSCGRSKSVQLAA